MQAGTPPIHIPASPLTPALIERIIEENSGEDAAEIIRAINGTPFVIHHSTFVIP